MLLNLFYKIPCSSNKDLYQIVPINYYKFLLKINSETYYKY